MSAAMKDMIDALAMDHTITSRADKAFDYSAQNFTILVDDVDHSELLVSLKEATEFKVYATQLVFSYGVQLGSCLIILLVLLLYFGKARTQRQYILNLLGVIFAGIRAGLLAWYMLGPWTSDFYTYITKDYADINDSATAVSILAVVACFPLLVTISVNLFLQGWVTLGITTPRRVRWGYIFVSVVLTLACLGSWLAQATLNVRNILGKETWNYTIAVRLTYHISTTCLTSWYSLVSMLRIGFFMYKRKQMGWKQLTVYQIFMIMTFQTMLLPAMFTIFQYTATEQFPEAQSLVLSSIAVLLPFTAIWTGLENTSADIVLYPVRHSAKRSAGLVTDVTDVTATGDVETGMELTTYNEFESPLDINTRKASTASGTDSNVDPGVGSSRSRSVTEYDDFDMEARRMGITL